MIKQVAALAGLGVLAFTAIAGYSAFKAPLAASASLETAHLQGGAGSAGAQNLTVFQIDQQGTTASFSIDEVLRGTPKTVVGTTNQVAGQLALDPSRPETALLSMIQINARTLTTDDNQRNNILKNQILKTNQNELITFAPTSISGLPATSSGGPYSFEMTGDLTISGKTRPATFDVTVTSTSSSQIQGTATAMVNYTDWGVSVPSVPFVAGVGSEVKLELDFTARAP